MNNVLMSIKPKYVEMLLAGDKAVELRRRNARLSPGTRIWIYATSPWRAIVATATVESVHCANPENVWELFGDRVGVCRSDFDSYVENLDLVSAIMLQDVRRLTRPLRLANTECIFRPPQSYAYLRHGVPLLHALQAR